MSASKTTPRSNKMSHGVSVDRQSTRKKPNKCKTCCRKFVAFIFSHVGLSGLVVGYSIMGAFAFKALEAPHEEKKNHEISELRKQTVNKLWDITIKYNVLYQENWTSDIGVEIRSFQDEIIKAVKDGYDGRDGKTSHYQWTLSGGFLYSLTVITTIGYGNIAPRTEWGKIVTIIYAIVGIPLMLLYLANIGDILAKSFKYIYKRICRCGICSDKQNKNQKNKKHNSPRVQNLKPQNSILNKNPSTHRQNSHHRHVSLYQSAFQDYSSDKPYHGPEENIQIETLSEENETAQEEEKEEKVTVPITLCLIIMVTYIFGGALLFSLWEDWDYLDGSYFCFITLSTIGFGDLVPGDNVISDSPDSQEKLVFCSLYVLIGMALIAMCFNLMQEEVINKVKSLGKKCGIVKDDD